MSGSTSPSKEPSIGYEFTRDWFSAWEKDWLRHFSHFSGNPASFVEIGSLEGRSAIWMLDHLLDHPESSIVCIDLFSRPDFEARFDANLEKSGHQEKVRKLKGMSWRKLRELEPESFDLVYVDGSHFGRDVLEDAVLSYRLLKPKGFLVFDDYPWDKNSSHSVLPKEAIDAFLHLYQDDVDVIHKAWQVFVQKQS